MLKTRKKTNCWQFSGLIGAAVYFAVILVMILVVSLLVVNGRISADGAEIAILLIATIASYLGCLMAGMLTEGNKLYCCAAVFATSLAVRLMLTLFTYEGNLGTSIVYSTPELIGFALALLTVAKRGGKVRTKKIKKRYL